MLSEKSFFFQPLTEQEINELAGTSHKKLLENAFFELSHELDTAGNTQRFFELREAYGKKIVNYWRGKYLHYQDAKKEGRLKRVVGGEELVIGDERLMVVYIGVYEKDEQALHITRSDEHEKDEVSITANINGSVDQFIDPSTIKCVIRDPEERLDVHYNVVFRNGRISSFERTLIRHDRDFGRPNIKDTRTINSERNVYFYE